MFLGINKWHTYLFKMMKLIKCIAVFILLVGLGYYLGNHNVTKLDSSSDKKEAVTESTIIPPNQMDSYFRIDGPKGQIGISISKDVVYVNPFGEQDIYKPSELLMADYPYLFKQGVANASFVTAEPFKSRDGRYLIEISNNQFDHGGYSPTYRVYFDPLKAEPTYLTGNKTEVNIYTQVGVPYVYGPMSGECWTDSIAAPTKQGAWRCKSGDKIYDPCFETIEGRVVCGANPDNPNVGFELTLTKPLPKPLVVKTNDDNSIWRVLLTNAVFCYKETGTTTMIDGVVYSFMCGRDELRWLKGNSDEVFDKNGGEWTVGMVQLKPGSEEIEKSEVVGVAKVWK